MKKVLLSLTVFSSLVFSNEFDKQIPELFNKMIDKFDNRARITPEEINDIITKYKNGKLVFCQTNFQRNIISKKKNWILDKTNKLFINTQKESYYYIYECRVFKDSDKIYL